MSERRLPFRSPAWIAVLRSAGCAIGPDYRPPAVPVSLPEGFVEARGTGYAGAAPVSTEVWKSFGEPELDALIARAQQENRSIAQAGARLEQARALRGLSYWTLLPSVTASGNRERSEPSDRDPFLPPDQGETTVYRAGLDASRLPRLRRWIASRSSAPRSANQACATSAVIVSRASAASATAASRSRRVASAARRARPNRSISQEASSPAR